MTLSTPTITGLIVKAQSGFFTVQTADAQYVCRIRGKMQHERLDSDLLAVGDRVVIRALEVGTAQILEVLPRTRVLSRRDPRPGRREHEQIIIANPDQAVLIFACTDPAPHLGMLDRYLVTIEAAGLPAVICANKVDLTALEQAQALFGPYAALGYTVVYVSAQTHFGMESLRERLVGKLNVFTGPSGVGKSSLLNALQPGLGLKARAISQATAKGRHTTVTREIWPLDSGGFVADTPGLKALALWDIRPEELDAYFPEMRTRLAQCLFTNCTHTHEPECAIRAAVTAGVIAPARYQSYLRMRAGQEDEGG